MVRRIPSQVHHQVGRLGKHGLVEQPVWLDAVLMNPPMALPPRAPPSRTAYDQPKDKARTQVGAKQKMRPPKNRPAPIVYLEDQVRRQFFQDHPFEAFRPSTLTENGQVEDAHPIQGQAWTRLRQRGRNPYPEDAVRFTVSLHEHHNMPLSYAYARAVGQFRSLRAEHAITQRFALLENETFGLTYNMSEIKLGHQKEMSQLNTWDTQAIADASEHAARKRWRSIMANYAGGSREWTGGQAYQEQWQEGYVPDYRPDRAELHHEDSSPVSPPQNGQLEAPSKTMPQESRKSFVQDIQYRRA